MSRKCGISGKCKLAGNLVSHSNRKTRRAFTPNLQNVTVLSDALKKSFRLRIAVHTLRSIDVRGGLDTYLLSTSDSKLTIEAQKIKRQLKKHNSRKELA